MVITRGRMRRRDPPAPVLKHRCMACWRQLLILNATLFLKFKIGTLREVITVIELLSPSNKNL